MVGLLGIRAKMRMTDTVWKLVPVNPTPRMISAAIGLTSDSRGYTDVAAKCVRDWNDMVKAAPPAPSLQSALTGRAVTVEALARYLFETDDPDVEELSWPEHEEDDGSRGNGGWVKLVSPLVADEYRNRASGLLRFMGCAACA